MNVPGGRPSKFDQTTADRILLAIRNGNYREPAALWAGVSPRTLRHWLLIGKQEPDGPLGKFRDDLLKAECEVEIRMVHVITAAAARSPDYAIKYLERKHRERWGPPRMVEVSGPRGGPIRTEHHVDLRRLNSDELDLMERILEKASSPEGAEPTDAADAATGPSGEGAP